MSKLNIEWVQYANMTGDHDASKIETMYLFEYGGKYNFRQFYLNIPKQEAVERFTGLMEDRNQHEMEQEGWDVKAHKITFVNGEAWIGNAGAQFKDLSEALMGAMLSGDLQ